MLFSVSVYILMKHWKEMHTEGQLLTQVIFVSNFLCLWWVSFVSTKKLFDDAHADFDVTVSKVKKHSLSEVVVFIILSLCQKWLCCFVSGYQKWLRCIWVSEVVVLCCLWVSEVVALYLGIRSGCVVLYLGIRSGCVVLSLGIRSGCIVSGYRKWLFVSGYQKWLFCSSVS